MLGPVTSGDPVCMLYARRCAVRMLRTGDRRYAVLLLRTGVVVSWACLALAEDCILKDTDGLHIERWRCWMLGPGNLVAYRRRRVVGVPLMNGSDTS